MTDTSTRLNKFIALHTGVSRREADELIQQGKVTINDQPAGLGSRVEPTDRVVVDGKAISATTAFRYILFHKPVGYVCSRRAQGDNPTIYDLIPSELHTLKPVGRLDKDSSGVLLLTNDGDFAHRMTHPSFAKTKHYIVHLDRDLEPLHQQMVSDFGVQLDDGTSKLGLTRLSDTSRRKWQVTMSEGRNRQIRRTFDALGYRGEQHWQSHLDDAHAVQAVSEQRAQLAPISERIASMVAALGGDVYVSGPSGRNYLDESPFHERGIAVDYWEHRGPNPCALELVDQRLGVAA